MSFFEEGDEPRTTIATARRPGRRARGQPPRRPLDERTVLARRAGAIAALVVVVVVVVFGLRAYLTSQQTQALKNYNADVTTLLQNEQQQVAQQFFGTLNNIAGTSGQALTADQSNLYQDAVTARIDAQTAAGWSVPGSCADAQRDLLIVLDMRYEAIDKVQAAIVQAINGPGGNAQIQDIAGDMGMLYASDILYKVRVAPLIEQALTSAGIQVGTGAVYSAPFLPDQSWTTAGYAAGKILRLHAASARRRGQHRPQRPRSRRRARRRHDPRPGRGRDQPDHLHQGTDVHARLQQRRRQRRVQRPHPADALVRLHGNADGFAGNPRDATGQRLFRRRSASRRRRRSGPCSSSPQPFSPSPARRTSRTTRRSTTCASASSFALADDTFPVCHWPR